jgi:hypothetical protein
MSDSPSESGSAPAELELNGEPPPDPISARAESIKRIFALWCTTYGHEQAALDPKRRKLIGEWLKLYSEADLCACISGYKNSPHHMGQNKSDTVYDSIELMLRDAKHIDAGIAFQRTPPRTDLSPQTRRIIDNTKDWVPPELRGNANGTK